MVDLAYDWELMSWGMRAIVIALAAALAIVVLSPHVAVLKPIAEKLGLTTTQYVTKTVYVPINHTVVKYVNQTVIRYINQTVPVPVYINRTVYVPVGLNKSLSAYLNDLFGWNGLRCWIVTFIYDNATPYYYEGNATGSIATIGTMIVPQQLLGRFDEVMHGGGPNGTYYYPYGILQLRGSSLTFIYAFGGSINITEIMPLGGELFIPRNTSVPAVFIFGDWLGVGPSPPTFYYAVINNTGNYIMVEYHGLGVNDYTIMRYNQTYTVLIFTRVFIDDHLTSQLAYPFACNWTVIGPVDPNVIMSYPIPYAWTSAEIFAAFDGNLTMSAVEHIYQHNNFGYWVWNLLIPTTNTSLPYPTS